MEGEQEDLPLKGGKREETDQGKDGKAAGLRRTCGPTLNMSD